MGPSLPTWSQERNTGNFKALLLTGSPNVAINLQRFFEVLVQRIEQGDVDLVKSMLTAELVDLVAVRVM